MRDRHVDWMTVALGLAAFAALAFWKWRLNVVVVVLAGGVLGLLRPSRRHSVERSRERGRPRHSP